jgi:hypothetical protein
MAIFRHGQEVNPEALIGMKPEDLKAKLEAAASKEDLKAATDAIEAQKGTLASIQESLKALTTPKPAAADPADQPDPAVAVLTDPAKFVSDATAPLTARQNQTQADLEEMKARARYSNHFSQFGEELMKVAKEKYTIAQRAQPNFWDFLMQNFVGAKVISGEIKPGNYPSLLGSSAHGPRADGSNSDPNMGFSDDMASWLKGRMPLEQARKIFDLTVRDGEPMTLANYKGKAN